MDTLNAIIDIETKGYSGHPVAATELQQIAKYYFRKGDTANVERISELLKQQQETRHVKLTRGDGEKLENINRMLHFPAEITLSTISRQCNIKCRFCEQAYTNIPDRVTPIKIFKKALDAIPDNLFCKVNVGGYMEPLAVKEWFPYAELACHVRPNANIGFNTNGSLLSAEKSKFLIDIGLKYLVISLNMPDRESYLKFTGKDFFAVVEKNIKTMAELKDKMHSEWPKICVQFLKLPPVVGNEQMLRDAWLPYCDSVYFRNVSVPSPSPEKLAEFKNVYPDLPDTQVPRPAATPCLSTLVTCAVDMFGYYIPCCVLTLYRNLAGKRKYKYMECGHIDEMNIVEAWQSEAWYRRRAMQLSGISKICRYCQINQGNADALKNYKKGVQLRYGFGAKSMI